MSTESFVNLSNARRDDQRDIMRDIDEQGVCPFCPEHLTKFHKQPILRQGDHWLVTSNQWPYPYTSIHLLAISTYHAEKMADLQDGSFAELQQHALWAEATYRIAAGGLAMRFGDIGGNAATVRHLHAHFIVPSPDRQPDEKVRFRIG